MHYSDLIYQTCLGLSGHGNTWNIMEPFGSVVVAISGH
jgi:hypothetical protein